MKIINEKANNKNNFRIFNRQENNQKREVEANKTKIIMNTETKKVKSKRTSLSDMPSLSTKQIESILFEEVGGDPKKLKHIKDKHPMMNIHGLIRINGEYYQWVYSNR